MSSLNINSGIDTKGIQDNRITSLGLLEPKSAQRTTADRIVDEFYQKEYGKEGLNWSN